MTHSIKSMKSRIWRALLSASDQEIHEGMHFYPGAHGLCRFLSRVFSVPLETCAGIYAALSPMNTWDCNVSNIIDVLRWKDNPNLSFLFTSPRVNSPNINRERAIAIALGSDPLSILRGHKVRAFYHCILNPNDHSQMVIDRHLINLALGVIPDKPTQSDLANDRDLISLITDAYQQLGKREHLGNRLASIAWFVQRRIERTGQLPLPHPQSPVCCNHPMTIQGRLISRRFKCLKCKSTRESPSILIDGFRLGINRNRTIIYLSPGHPYANKWGWQYLSRYRVMVDLNRPLRSDEHVHHIDLDKFNDQPDNLEVLLCEYHGRLHGLATVIGRHRNDLGMFEEIPEPHPNPHPWPRHHAILGPEAKI